MEKKIVIAVDGHSSCGKSTLAGDLARSLGYVYIDTGAMYRAVTLYSLRHNLWQGNEPDTEALRRAMPNIHIALTLTADGLPHTLLNGEDVEKAIRSMDVSNHVSPIAAIDFVRRAMTEAQKAMGEKKGIVMDGRDIGTTVFPHAELKIFLTARPEIRALRRYEELRAKGENVRLEDVSDNLRERDRIDSTRTVSPLRRAEDAVTLDNSDISEEEQLQQALEIARRIIACP